MREYLNENLLKLIRGLSLFKGFTPQEAQKLLQVGKLKKVKGRQTIYQIGAPSTDMLILCKGALIVQSEKGINIARIKPGECVGEMGVLTDTPRSARVVAVEDSLGLVIQKKALLTFLKGERGLNIKFQRNVIDLLAGRLRKTGKLVDEVASEKWRQRRKAPTEKVVSGRMERVMLHLPVDVAESLKAHAEVTSETVSDVVRRALSLYFVPATGWWKRT
ncbi:MAG: cyclic nucleotide-binding domain-containing protein [Deltaproteobacteria bacterium]|nr:cyclic nucleotide-binding domain-containing protein [Deltaproteobacteria bacterium]